MAKHITNLSMARSGHNFVLQNVLSWFEDGEDYIHHNLENIDPKRLKKNHLKHGGYRLLIYRDFDDWVASIIMKSYNNQPTRSRDDIPQYIRKVVEIYWLQISEAKYPIYFNQHMVIHYDEFVRSKSYRKYVCRRLKGEYNEKMIDHVPANGNHSSFDGEKFKDKGSQMKVLDRAKQILDTQHAELFTNIIKEYGRQT